MRVFPSHAIAAALIAGAGAAHAADLPPRSPAPYQAPVAVPAAYNWTGFYVGANGGFGFGDYNVSAEGVTGSAFNLSGPVAGGQVGFNYQAGNFVWGVEVDGQWSNIKDTQTFDDLALEAKVAWFMTARGRAGVAVQNFLLYATGGYTYGGFEASATSGGVTVTGSESRGGWNVGGGVEAGFGNWSFKVEYLYLRSFEEDFTIDLVPVSDYVQAHVVRGGLNYRFGAGGPVVARY
jgi:outer membrane immunogenic protein